MRRILSDTYQAESNNSAISSQRFAVGGGSIALALGCVMAFAAAVAREPAESEVNNRNQAASAVAVAEPAPERAALPPCLRSLGLSTPQQDQVAEISRQYDTAIASVWTKFRECYRNTIDTEILLLAAIEDNLTEVQRTQVRAQRRKVAQQEKLLAGTSSKPSQATTSPDSAVEESIGMTGVSLTAEQEAAADKLQERYLSHLRSLNRDIQGLHTRLVSLEADKLVEIEKVLTPDQLKQLRTNRQTAPEVLTTAARPSAATKTD